VKPQLASDCGSACPLCALDLNLKHSDVLVLGQFVRPDGRIVPRYISGLCDAQQYRITMLVTMAKKAGLLPNLQPANSHCDPLKRRGSRKLHRYFDESTIKNPKIGWILRYKPERALGVRAVPTRQERNAERLKFGLRPIPESAKVQ